MCNIFIDYLCYLHISNRVTSLIDNIGIGTIIIIHNLCVDIDLILVIDSKNMPQFIITEDEVIITYLYSFITSSHT